MSEKPHTFSISFHLESEMDLSGKKLSSGYYRFTYDLAGTNIANPCEYSPDRWKWERCDAFPDLGSFQEFFEKLDPVPTKIETEDYVETFTYRGISVPVFCDDYGQCFYCIFQGKVLCFGSFQTEYEDEIRFLVNNLLDDSREFSA